MTRSTMTPAPSGFLRFGLTVLAVGALLIGSNWLRTHLEAQAWSAISALDDEKAPDLRFVMEIQHPIDSYSPEGAAAALPQSENRTCARARLRAEQADGGVAPDASGRPAPPRPRCPPAPSCCRLPSPLPALARPSSTSRHLSTSD